MHREDDVKRLSRAYLISKQEVLDLGFESELLWQHRMRTVSWTESQFLRETAWVILSSGMREAVIRRIFPELSKQFFRWDSAQAIADKSEECRTNAFSFFRNVKKIDAIITVAEYIVKNSFASVEQAVRTDGPAFLQKFPFLGPATSLHLAKNLGIDIVKPDRHLMRIAHAFQFASAHHLCTTISEYVGDDISEIDLVFWRYATIDKNYIGTLKANFNTCS